MPIAIVSNAAQAAARSKRGMHMTPDEVFAGYVYGDPRRATHAPHDNLKAAQEVPALVADQVPTRTGTAPSLEGMEARRDPGNGIQRLDAFNRPNNLGPRGQVDAMRANQLARDTTSPNTAQKLGDAAREVRTAAFNQSPADVTLDQYLANAVLQEAEKGALLRGAATLQRMP